MLILIFGIALIGAALTITVLLPYGLTTALVAAPFGASLSVIVVALLVDMVKE